MKICNSKEKKPESDQTKCMKSTKTNSSPNQIMIEF